VTDCVSVVAVDSSALAEADGDGEAVGSAAASQLELRPTKQMNAHEILFTSHHRIEGTK